MYSLFGRVGLMAGCVIFIANYFGFHIGMEMTDTYTDLLKHIVATVH